MFFNALLCWWNELLYNKRKKPKSRELIYYCLNNNIRMAKYQTVYKLPWTFNSAICGFHYCRKYWSRKIEENLVFSNGRNKTFDIFPIKTCKEDGEIFGHLPRKLSRTLTFQLDRGYFSYTSTHYRRYSFVQDGVEIPCKVTVEMSLTLKNTQIMDRLMKFVKTLYSEPHSSIILGSILADELEVEFLSNETGQKLPKTKKEKRQEAKRWMQ